MSVSEFDLIRRYFTRPTPSAILGVGDDAALLQIGMGKMLAVSTDMLVSGTHFFANADPFGLGHKTLAVNLSDLAAMGAVPRWATLALSLPAVDHAWLAQFSCGFFSLAEQHGVELVGGDTTRGPLNISVTVMGEVPQNLALRRDGAQLGDDIWVSGSLGDAALALAHLQGRLILPEETLSDCQTRLHQPQPRVALGLALRGIAHSAIDISDGLLADLGHILSRSAVGADIRYGDLPVSETMLNHLRTALLSEHETVLTQRCILSGGDDYELCFTAPIERREKIEIISHALDLPLSRIGTIVPEHGCTVRAADGGVMITKEHGYDHFAS